MLEKPEGQSRNTGNIGHKTQNGDKQQKYNTENIKRRATRTPPKT
jgi:hypothetical protein